MPLSEVTDTSTQSLFIIVPLFIIVLTEKCTFLCNVYCVLCIVYCVLFIVYCVLCIVYCLLCIVYCAGTIINILKVLPMANIEYY